MTGSAAVTRSYNIIHVRYRAAHHLIALLTCILTDDISLASYRSRVIYRLPSYHSDVISSRLTLADKGFRVNQRQVMVLFYN